MAEQKQGNESMLKEAVCVDVGRVFDSCCDRDCLEDLRCFFTPDTQELIDDAINVRCRSAEIINVSIDVEPIHFNRGFFSVELTFCFLIKLDVFTAPHAKPIEVKGVCFFDKKVILYGSEGNVKVFTSKCDEDKDDDRDEPICNSPKNRVCSAISICGLPVCK